MIGGSGQRILATRCAPRASLVSAAARCFSVKAVPPSLCFARMSLAERGGAVPLYVLRLRVCVPLFAYFRTCFTYLFPLRPPSTACGLVFPSLSVSPRPFYVIPSFPRLSSSLMMPCLCPVFLPPVFFSSSVFQRACLCMCVAVSELVLLLLVCVCVCYCSAWAGDIRILCSPFALLTSVSLRRQAQRSLSRLVGPN